MHCQETKCPWLCVHIHRGLELSKGFLATGILLCAGAAAWCLPCFPQAHGGAHALLSSEHTYMAVTPA